ncbi:ATP-binding protein [Sphingomonas sp. LB-2]|uniref:ATP-binding protein n=1 Tax=Sphingomonas caeni TaxID=2984949 RepID=UPI002231F4E6|nr:ATP-binding protein [Sphingomonas caeni]MCW3846502.1 ATP-binding protein [Sphingomonas caeni]
MTAAFAPAPAAWRAANQAAFVAAVTEARGMLAMALAGEGLAEVPILGSDPPPVHAQLAAGAGLTAFEHWLLLLCAGAEVDADTRALCAAWHGDPARDRPSLALALACHPEPHWSALTPHAPLRRHDWLRLDEGPGLTQRMLSVDEELLHACLGEGGAPEAIVARLLHRRRRDGLDALAQRIDLRGDGDALVLPEQQCDMLAQVAGHVRHRDQVLGDWGFAARSRRGLGLSVLFTGPSGTGKTLASETIARELGYPLYRVDLAALVSKYIGETEKNLETVLDAAEREQVVLLFDEADALFGRRSAVRDSHDRYANQEVSFLLQRLESFSGLAILTSNLPEAIDPAFMRRFRFVIAFPFPDQAQREAIWASVLPPAMPREPLDLARLARFLLAGGSIRTVALNAAFRAAAEGVPVGMPHLLAAVHAELVKLGQPLPPGERG